MMRKALIPGMLIFASGCMLGPDYDRPDLSTPEDFRAAASTTSAETPFGELLWNEVFLDPVLQDLIRTALMENYDIRLAAERVLESRSRVKIARSELFPFVEGGPRYDWTRATEHGAVPLPPTVDPEQDQWSLTGNLTWEIDFWGRVRRATEAARAELLATELARLAVVQSLVAEVALAYFGLLELDAELEIARRTLQSRRKSEELVSLRLGQGVANKVELRQAESLVLDASRRIPDLELAIEQQENLIRLLLGGNPGPVPRGGSLMDQDLARDVPAGLPSSLLDRRPDVMAAEQELIAANARIGEAKALLFPAIRLTASGGVASEHLDDLFRNGSRVWNVSPSITQPIFQGGRLWANLLVSESQRRQAVLLYRQTVQQSLRDVADALVARQKSAEVRSWQARLESTLRDQTELSRMRYRGGVTSYLEVLDSDRDHFNVQLDLVRAVRDELAAIVFLYRSLGGGWQGAEELAAAPTDE